MTRWHTLKGFLAGGIAMIACPCHLPLTLPFLLAITAGTALGSWLAANTLGLYLTSGSLFLVSLVLTAKWLLIDEQPAVAKVAGRPTEIILVASKGCQGCHTAADLWAEVSSQFDVSFRKVDIASAEGRDLAARHHILTTPTTLLNDTVVFRGVPDRPAAMALFA